MLVQGVCVAGVRIWAFGDSDDPPLRDGPLSGAMIAHDVDGLEDGAGDSGGSTSSLRTRYCTIG